jgi:hypothetical protein
LTRSLIFGLIASGIVLAYFIPWIFGMVKEDSTYGNKGERWGRYAYIITRSGSFVYEGSSYRLGDMNKPDLTAREILVEWFERDETPRGLRYTYTCAIRLEESGEWQGMAQGL